MLHKWHFHLEHFEKFWIKTQHGVSNVMSGCWPLSSVSWGHYQTVEGSPVFVLRERPLCNLGNPQTPFKHCSPRFETWQLNAQWSRMPGPGWFWICQGSRAKGNDKRGLNLDVLFRLTRQLELYNWVFTRNNLISCFFPGTDLPLVYHLGYLVW